MKKNVADTSSQLKLQTKRVAKKYSITGGILLACFVGFIVGGVLISDATIVKQSSYLEYLTLKSSADSAISSLQTAKTNLENTGINLNGNLMTQQEFLYFIGEETQSNNLDLIYQSGGETSTSNGISKINFKIQVSGSSADISNFLSKLSLANSAYSINSFSITQESLDLSWLSRYTDDEDIISWFNASELYVSSSDSYVETYDIYNLTYMLKKTDMVLYLDVDLISSK